MSKAHHYTTRTTWTGNRGSGTLDYRAYGRDHTISGAGKEHDIAGSSDPSFRGDAQRYNPEELFVSSLSACHMLWYLHLASVMGITVLEYVDEATGEMEEGSDGAGHFTSIVLHPRVTIARSDKVELANELHERAGKKCFIANSVRTPVTYEPVTVASA